MSKRKNNTLTRKKAFREYRPICWISAEGHTEQDYFGMNVFKCQDGPAIRFPKNIHPDRRNPSQVLKRFEKAMRTEDFRRNDEAWIVVDVDTWDQKEFDELFAWEAADTRHHLAISNPKFELFLLMHFETALGCTTPQKVDQTLKRYMPRFNKRLEPTAFNVERIQTAILNAEAKRRGCKNTFPAEGVTDAYRLAGRLIDRFS